jgi:spore coat polysaccharide biosynthesis protein SpsF
MKKALFITVRIDSSRLPNKALRLILGRPVIEMIILRAKQAVRFDEVVVCTTQRSVDDPIVDIAVKNGVQHFRGSLEDKLERWRGAAERYDLDYFVTFDGDDLFCDPALLDMGAEQMERRGLDFIEAPPGLICGAFTYGIKVSALQKVCSIKATDETEMMWTYFKDTHLFKTGVLENVEDIYFSDVIRLTLDYPEDLQFFEKVFAHYDCTENDVPLREIATYLKQNPEIPQINYFRQQEFLDNQQRKTKLVLKT